MRVDLALTLAGMALMLGTFGLLWFCLPNGREAAPIVSARLAPFATAAFAAAFLLAAAMTLAGFEYFGGR
jgi:NADH:ubiquinone oxidoreductase subunit 4 (subunit M)